MTDYTKIIDNIQQACKKEKEFFVDSLKNLVMNETPSENYDANSKLLNELADYFEAAGFQSNIIKGQKSGGKLFAQFPGDYQNGQQLLLGHADTVWPIGTLKKMPWQVNENIISGPGVYDMKAGIAMIMTAVKVINSLNLKPSLQPVVFINSDEETGSHDSKEEIIELAKRMKRVYVPEPSLDHDGKLKTRRKGSGLFNITINGVAAHAGIEPEKGVSAIHELSYVIRQLYELNDPDRNITINVGEISGGTASNVVAAKSTASVDVRVLNMEDANRIEQAIKSIKPTLKGSKISVKGGFNRPPMIKNNRNRKLWDVAKQFSKQLDINLKDGISGGGSDGSFTSNHTATLDGLGAVGEGAHSPDEKIYLSETLQRCALFSLLILAPDLSG